MNHFYEHLVRKESASESLHQAVQWLNNYSENWLPLIPLYFSFLLWVLLVIRLEY